MWSAELESEEDNGKIMSKQFQRLSKHKNLIVDRDRRTHEYPRRLTENDKKIPEEEEEEEEK